MNSDTLSQQEIDLLFGGDSGAQPAAPARRSSPDVQLYDFRRPNRISKERHRSLEAMYRLFSKSLETWLMTRVRSQVELELLAVEQLTFGEFLLSLPSPCASYVLDIEDSGGQQAVVDLGSEFAFFLVDRLLGGVGVPIVPDRVLTPLERLVDRMVADRAAAQLVEIWQDHVRFDLSVNRFEPIPDMLQAAAREDPVLVANIRVSAGNLRSSLLVCLPFAVIEKFFTSGSSGRVQRPRSLPGDRQVERRRLETSVRATRVPVSARLTQFRLAMSTLASLRPGMVVATGLPADGAVRVLVAGSERFVGRSGRVGQKLATRLEAAVSRDDGAESSDSNSLEMLP